MQIRKNRLLSMQEANETEYVDPDSSKSETAEARRLFARNNWPVIDVTRRSIEEIASAILNLYQEHAASPRRYAVYDGRAGKTPYTGFGQQVRAALAARRRS